MFVVLDIFDDDDNDDDDGGDVVGLVDPSNLTTSHHI